MKKSLSFWVVLVLLLSLGGGLLGSCATRTPQQKKTAWYKRHSGGKTTPCPCDR